MALPYTYMHQRDPLSVPRHWQWIGAFRVTALIQAVAVGLFLALAGCRGIPTEGERLAREDVKAVGAVYRSQSQRPTLSELTENSSLSNVMAYAILNQPDIEVAYYEWVSSIEAITVERSLPDPQLMVSADFSDVIMSLMPGLMMDFPGPGRREASANVATAESDAKYFAFETAVLRVAFDVKKALCELHFLDAKIEVTGQMLRLMGQLETLALIQNEVGRVTLQDVVQARDEQDRLTTAIADLNDSRQPLLAQYKASLGMSYDDPEPPVPMLREATPLTVTAEMLFTTALARNPRLKAMEAEVRLANASLQIAHKEKVPDFRVGLEADVMASPLMLRPSAGVSLPIWRDKLSAQLAEAHAGKQASEARLSSEQIMLAVEFAEKSFLVREASRTLELLELTLNATGGQALELAQSGYVGGKVDFRDVIDAEQALLELQLSGFEARLQQELALSELSLVILAVPPLNAPLLTSESAPGMAGSR